MSQSEVLQCGHLSALNIVSTIAAKEFKDNLRNRWLWMMAGVLLLLSLSVSFMGSVISGSLVVFEPAQILSGLVTLSVFMLPLGAILLSYDSFVGEKESGTLLLLLTYPLERWHLVCGKFLGHACVMTIASILGFGVTGVLLLLVGDAQAQLAIIIGFTHLIISSILLSLVFVLLGYWVSLCVREKAKALGTLLILWFVLVLVYDLILLSVLVGMSEMLNRNLFNLLILLNPTDLFRALNLLAAPSDTLAAKSSLSLIAQTGLGLPMMYGLLGGWIIVLLLGCSRVFKRQEI
ncbi:ABC transporter permease [Shewanella baltica]|uniref:ABC transporter permease n=1 Tax=Shewanella baltica TaxID=62322 RepID=UPI00014F914A|nr:ABC transporter permease subunit [Shewanella baltica]ABS09992.1 copper ABC transporter, permease protein [Shewanella baltica OS185]HCE50537.1 copper ABC transporter permease [Shewanella baltica]